MNYGSGYSRTTNQYAPPKVNTRPKVRLRVSYNLQNSDQGLQHGRHCFGINSLAINEEDGILYSGGRDSTVRSWDVKKMPVPEHLSCFEHHTDWVNDIFLCNNNKTMVSCSSDASIKIWDTDTNQCCRTLNRHGDYVKALAYAPQAGVFASAGLDTNIFVWDIQQCTAPIVALPVTSSPSLSCSSGFRNNVAPAVRTGVEKGSLYSLAINSTATIALSGSTERTIRAWDPRSGQKLFKLKGHTDNIKSLLVNDEGTLCVSGSSDFTLRLWDLRQQQCIHVYEVHDDSVWSVAVDPTFTSVYSGGRDGSVFVTDLVTSNSTLLCTEQNPVVKLLHTKHGGDSLWISTTDSCIKNWALNSDQSQQKKVYSPPSTLSSSPTTSSFQGSKTAPIVSAPRSTILGRAGMIKHHILNNRRHVLTKDSSGTVELWDITQGKKIESFGVTSFESKAEALTEIISVPNWFSADTKTGSLTVHLDCPQCFSAEVYGSDVFEDLPEENEEIQMNLGESVLRALFSYWEEGRRALETNRKPDTSRHLQVPGSHGQNNQLQPNGTSTDHKKSSDSIPKDNHNHNQNHVDNNKLSHSAAVPSASLSTSTSISNSTSTLTNSTTALTQSTTLNNSSVLGNSTALSNSSSLTKGNPNGTVLSNDDKPRENILPILSLPADVSVIISEEGTGATMHRATRNQFVGDEPPEIIPPWVVDCLLHNDIPPTTMRALSVKLGFFLLTADEKELPSLPQGSVRLSALRLLRVKKVARYVAQKLNLDLPLLSDNNKESPSLDDKTDASDPPSSEGSEAGSEERVPAEQYIEILCNNKVLQPHYSLATIKAFFWKSGDENIVLHYRINPSFAHPQEGGEKKSKKGSSSSKSNNKKAGNQSNKDAAPKRTLFHRKT